MLLPSQLGYHWWPNWSFVNGIRVDYLSPVLFSTDLILLGLFLLSLRRIKINFKVFAMILIAAAVNIYQAFSPEVALWGWVKVAEALFLVWYVFKNHYVFSSKLWTASLTLSIIWTAMLGTTQLVKQSSIGGWWYSFGERRFNVSTPGIAKVVINGKLWLRPYATFPHPNAMAGFVFLVQGLIIIFSQKRVKIPIWLKLINPLCAGLILISMSRSVMFLEIVALTLLYFKQKWTAIVAVLFAGLIYFLPANPQSIAERQILNAAALKSIALNPFSGIGLTNFIPYIAKNFPQIPYQPVHNIYLLLILEVGLPAFIIFLYLIFISIKRPINISKPYLLITGGILLSGMVDHYWLTLHQNYLLLAVFVGLLAVQFANHDRLDN